MKYNSTSFSYLPQPVILLLQYPHIMLSAFLSINSFTHSVPYLWREIIPYDSLPASITSISHYIIQILDCYHISNILELMGFWLSCKDDQALTQKFDIATVTGFALTDFPQFVY